jgi:hypothetical protein
VKSGGIASDGPSANKGEKAIAAVASQTKTVIDKLFIDALGFSKRDLTIADQQGHGFLIVSQKSV